MKNSVSIVKRVINTEKSTDFKQKDNKYTFEVDISANKIDVARAIEELFKVKVVKVNTSIVTGKKRRVRSALGKRPDWKKAIVKLRAGDRIESLE